MQMALIGYDCTMFFTIIIWILLLYNVISELSFLQLRQPFFKNDQQVAERKDKAFSDKKHDNS
jgi:hypothetical protein